MSRVKNSRKQEWAARAVETGWLVVTIAVPLAFNPWGTSAFELPKTALLTALILLMGSAVLAQAVEKGHLQLHRPQTPLLLPVLLLGGAYILATIFSVNPRVSLWGSYERQQGLLTQGAYLVLFLLTATNLHTHTQVERLWKALVWGSAPVAAYGLLQAAEIDPLGWQTTGASTVLSTTGRSNFFGSYLVIIAPLTAARLFQARRRWPYAILLAGQLICLALTQARGAWVGMGAAIIVGLLAWTVATRNWRSALAALQKVISHE